MHAALTKIINALGSLFIAKKGIETCQKGKTTRTLTALTLTVLTVVVVIASIITLVNRIFIGQASTLSLFQYHVGYALMQLAITLIGAAAMLLAAQILLYHARDVSAETDTPYTASWIVSNLLQMLGELVFLFISTGGLLTLIASFGGHGFAMLGFGTASNILVGIIALIIAPLIGGLVKLLFYFAAERVTLFTDIARNTKK